MTFEQTLQTLLSINPLHLVKAAFILGLLLYSVFSYVMLRQEQLMSQVVYLSANTKIRALILAHLLATLFVLLLAVVIL
ncbi:MAG: hypothetical protein M1120_03650 [Patescibacteria group bacterium]|nr:hypothetical protein [Patescibacteria group bacterium]